MSDKVPFSVTLNEVKGISEAQAQMRSSFICRRKRSSDERKRWLFLDKPERSFADPQDGTKTTPHVPVIPPAGGVKRPSFIKCEDVRSVSRERLIAPWGSVSWNTMNAIEDRLRILLDL